MTPTRNELHVIGPDDGNFPIIDTHSHLLPGVDHGSPDSDTSLRMAWEAAAFGVTTVVCTPHLYEYDTYLLEEARRTFHQFRAALTQAGVNLEVRLGFEVAVEVVVTAGKRELDSLVVEDTQGRDGAGVLIIEVPFHGWPVFMEETMFRLATQGYLPVLAHPERNDRVRADPAVLRSCLEAGAVLQATAGSLSPLFRRDSARSFEELLNRGWYSVLASDAHADTEYTYTPAALLAELGERVSPATWRKLLCDNPRLLLAGRRPPRGPEAALQPRGGRGLRGLWRRKR